MGKNRSVLIGDKAFYKSVLTLAVPVMIQNSVTNLVNLLDNIMVGQLGTGPISGVAIVGQLFFVFALCIFGALSGPSIFGAQFYGAGDTEGLRNTFRLKVWMSGAVWLLMTAVFVLFHDPLIHMFLTGQGAAALADATLSSGREYLYYMIPGMLPFALSMCYGTTLREAGETMLPMKAGIAAMLANLLGNWLLIYGHLGFPAWGVKGAAVATVIARFVELGILLFAVHKSARFSFFHRMFNTLRVPIALVRQVMKKGAPLFLNEAMWSIGIAMLNQAYSVRSLIVLSGLSISSTALNLFNVFFLSMGNAVAIMVGHSLGAGKLLEARERAWKLLFFSFMTCVGIGAVVGLLSGVFPGFYNVSPEAQRLAAGFILVSALYMPFNAVSNGCYFILRSGGSVLMTFMFDSVFAIFGILPFTWALVYWTDLPIGTLYAISQGANLIKFCVGLILVRSGRWQRNIVSVYSKAEETG